LNENATLNIYSVILISLRQVFVLTLSPRLPSANKPVPLIRAANADITKRLDKKLNNPA